MCCNIRLHLENKAGFYRESKELLHAHDNDGELTQEPCYINKKSDYFDKDGEVYELNKEGAQEAMKLRRAVESQGLAVFAIALTIIGLGLSIASKSSMILTILGVILVLLAGYLGIINHYRLKLSKGEKEFCNLQN